MRIGFTQFSKRDNSTLLPRADTLTFYEGVLKEDSGIISPTVRLTLLSGTTPLNSVNWNYAYIPDFKRYYYINDWVSEKGQWVASMSVDVLASFRDFIGTSTQYILRCSATSDGNVIDNMYPAKNYITHEHTFADSGMSADLASGSFIVGIINGSVSETGCVTYYVMTLAEIAFFMSWLLTEGNYDFSDNLAFAYLNPIQYVTSCVWLPFKVPAVNVDSVKVGFWTVTGASARRIAGANIGLGNIVLDVPQHPQAAARGAYLNYAPYTRAQISCLPFAQIPLDLNYLSNDRKINIDIHCDATSGYARMTVTSGGTLLRVDYAQIGVSLSLAQGVNNPLTSTAELLTTGYVISDGIGSTNAEKAVSLGTEAALGALQSTRGAALISNAVKTWLPQFSKVGSQGFFGNIDESAHLYCDYTHIVDEDNADLGRPLMQKRQINTISGYILVNDADIAIDGYAGELAAIKNYMNGGFFYE